jgi:DNA-directed RNA polymerase specialized sigma24 family protein
MHEPVTNDLERALESLSEEARLAVLLDLQGFSEAEMAEIMACAAKTVRLQLFHARATLRERLRDDRRR